MRKILIIGASSGIGAALTRLAQGQFQTYSVSRSDAEPGLSEHFNCDVLTDALPALDEPLAGLVYCPGSINLKPFATIKLDQFRQDLELNLLGAVRCLQHYQRNLQAADTASVVLFSTVAVNTGFPYHATVAAAKGAVEGLTRSLAAEWAPKIRVNAIAPSLTNTPLAERLIREDAKKQAAAARHALNRIGEAEDIAQMALFLLSDKASWITGQIMRVDGGISAVRT
ncbi:SDR family NAD(P)-dependent oxidoreductase [Methylotuvimicrobium buryatense]|uniref:SDR family oxidoreductase n=1 Tax=Methylotuvimicrobium buryatense TaxID=95641 RepID=A0A4P9URY2_METBY|nr:SDR family oxidoreductase [Methylotuvimicrobium buryatense]QCW84258.1 SDR family oxidoreductase [Methylotuvimicrobium buryatense]